MLSLLLFHFAAPWKFFTSLCVACLDYDCFGTFPKASRARYRQEHPKIDSERKASRLVLSAGDSMQAAAPSCLVSKLPFCDH
jgi:hypothetical protein